MSEKPHILFVDDNADIRELVRVILQAAGFRVSTSDSTTGALKLVLTDQFDALLIDYWMPEDSGIEFCRRIRALGQTTPVLICSGCASQADREAARSAGAQGYVSKPFNGKGLVQILHSVLANNTGEPHGNDLFPAQSASPLSYTKQAG